MFTPQGPVSPNEARTVRNNIFAYGRGGIMAITDPYTNGVPPSIPLVWNFTNNLIYFDRNKTSSPKFFVESGCVSIATNRRGYTERCAESRVRESRVSRRRLLATQGLAGRWLCPIRRDPG